jgi:hypothetical protein
VRRFGVGVLVGAIGVGGCYEGPSSAGATDSGGSETGDGTAAETGESGGEPGACDVGPGRVGLQRLTRAEYNRTVRDLFGVTSAPADAFPPDSSTGGFDNHAKSLTVSPQLAALLLDTAETVAAEAMANRGDEILDCDPGDRACVRDAVAALATRVYRRPPTADELDDLDAMVDFAAAEGDTFADGVEYALQAMLMAPQFLYRSVPVTESADDIVALDDYAVATRLSYFLWGSTPDDALLSAAGRGELVDPEGLRAQFDRMLADPKARALYDGFLGQWLQLGKLGAASPDPAAFPQWDDALRDQMLAETQRFWEDLRERDGSVIELVDGTSTFASAELAAIYGVSGIEGTSLQPIDLDPAERAGMLTMPAVLTMTSGPQQPNIVRRGVWLAETILCASPPPPPQGVPPAPDPEPGETERERLARHREDPTCAGCHNLIDPLGFAFENYDAIGRWRTEAEGEPVDNLGTLPDGTEFEGVVELAALLASGDAFPTCVSTKLMTYALGRTIDEDESCVPETIGADTVTHDAALSDLLWAVVTSESFLTEQFVTGQNGGGQ